MGAALVTYWPQALVLVSVIAAAGYYKRTLEHVSETLRHIEKKIDQSNDRTHQLEREVDRLRIQLEHAADLTPVTSMHQRRGRV